MLVAVCFPVSVTWALMAVHITRSAWTAASRARGLNAQLMRRELELGRTSTVDQLTGLATRREFDAMVRLEFGRFQRHGHPTSLLMVEIDEIHELRDKTGLAVAELASVLKESLRTIEFGCRFTETALAVLLLETNSEEARIVANSVREAVGTQTFLVQRRKGGYNLTVSLGVSTLGAPMASYLDFIRAAEQALVAARETPCDQVKIESAA